MYASKQTMSLQNDKNAGIEFLMLKNKHEETNRIMFHHHYFASNVLGYFYLVASNILNMLF